MTLFIAWIPYRGPKTTKMAKNGSFLVAMVTKINILVQNVDHVTRRVNTHIPCKNCANRLGSFDFYKGTNKQT